VEFLRLFKNFYAPNYVNSQIIPKSNSVNEYRINYKDAFLSSDYCNQCSHKNMIHIINENNEIRNPAIERIKLTIQEPEPAAAAAAESSECTVCSKSFCYEDASINYELIINYKIFIELLFKKMPSELHNYDILNASLNMDNVLTFEIVHFLNTHFDMISFVDSDIKSKYLNCANKHIHQYDQIAIFLEMLTFGGKYMSKKRKPKRKKTRKKQVNYSNNSKMR
jgi:hypothetical protein